MWHSPLLSQPVAVPIANTAYVRLHALMDVVTDLRASPWVLVPLNASFQALTRGTPRLTGSSRPARLRRAGVDEGALVQQKLCP